MKIGPWTHPMINDVGDEDTNKICATVYIEDVALFEIEVWRNHKGKYAWVVFSRKGVIQGDAVQFIFDDIEKAKENAIFQAQEYLKYLIELERQ